MSGPKANFQFSEFVKSAAGSACVRVLCCYCWPPLQHINQPPPPLLWLLYKKPNGLCADEGRGCVRAERQWGSVKCVFPKGNHQRCARESKPGGSTASSKRDWKVESVRTSSGGSSRVVVVCAGDVKGQLCECPLVFVAKSVDPYSAGFSWPTRSAVHVCPPVLV